MVYEISITPAALLDISESLEHYNTKAKDLGYKFADDIENNFRIISLNPKLLQSDTKMYEENC